MQDVNTNTPVNPDAQQENSEETIAIGAGFDFADPNSRLAPFYFRTSHVLAAAVLCGLFFFLNFIPLRQTDIWAHMKFGQWTIENGHLPQGNPFNPFLRQEIAPNHYSWLSQALFYLIYHTGEVLAGGDAFNRMAGGVDLLRFTHALLVVARLVVLLFAFQWLTGSFRLALLGTLMTVLINLGGHAVIFRPQLTGELCFALLLLALSRQPLSKQGMLAIPLIMVLWANLHGSFLIGLAMLGACLAGRLIEAGWAQRSLLPRTLLADGQVRGLAVAGLASVLLIALLNPAGPGIFQQALGMASHPVVRMMDEWEPMRLVGGPGGQYAYLITLVLLGSSLLYCRGRITPTAVLLILLFGVQPLLHQRALIWWLAILPWIILPMWLKGRSLAPPAWTISRSEPNLRKTLVALSLVVVALLWSAPSLWFLDGKPAPLERSVSEGTAWKFGFQLQGIHQGEEPWLPELDRWLHQHYPDGIYRGNIFTTETAGDYLVWALPGEMPVFMYAHVHLCSWEHWQQVIAVRRGTPYWRKVLDHHKMNLLVMEPEMNPRLRELLYQDNDWRVLYDETNDSRVVDSRCRLLIAVRKQPLR